MTDPGYFGALLCCLLVYALFKSRRRRGMLPFPPGPPGEPLIGHLRIFPRKHTTYLEWRKQYGMALIYRFPSSNLHPLGDIIYLNVIGKPIIILNTEEAANDLLQKKGKIYSERPYMPMQDMQVFYQLSGFFSNSELHRLGWGEMLTFINTGDSFNKARKLLQDPFTQSKCTVFQDLQLDLTHILLKDLLGNPTEFDTHLKRYGGNE
ncbi:hypothetical protein NLI96_g9266 [Meripilus lineatus]|uniref:Cytochrome P450 n=1 Tax=Meripilus lineatus TaxID=2056292 RepID=A0AAD5YB79_9APHY|nr:hypothetical protein NLI96_g9266 [Physisporinus lineatus]